MGLTTAASVKKSDAANDMAPALTEPISQSKLSSSATSGASPRTTSSVSIGDNSLVVTATVNTNAPATGGQQRGHLLTNNNNNNNNNINNGQYKGGTNSFVEQALEQLHRGSDGPIIGPSNENLHMDQITSDSAGISSSEEQAHSQQTASPISSSASNNMGLQKDFLKENPDMEQMLGELASTSEMELLQVFKSFESTPAGEGLCDLAGGLSLFNDVDVINMCEEVVLSSPPNKDNERRELHAEIEKRQASMMRKYDFLIRRLSKLQARYMGQHVSEEIAGLFEYSQRFWKKKDKEHNKIVNSGTSPTSLIPDIIPYQPPPQTNSDKMKPISANAMKTFVKRIESVSNAQSSTLSKRLHSQRYFHAGNSDNNNSPNLSIPGTSSTVTNFIPKFEAVANDQLEQTSGLLLSELKIVQSAIDSEATASSSGGESADEMIVYNNTTQQNMSISKRAAWRWAKDRASVASRWTWLLAQISDLEYRIRQHNGLHNQIKKNKGAVTLEEVNPQQPPSQQSVNGYRGILPGNSKPLGESIDNNQTNAPNGAYDQSTGSCRTRPFHRNGFRKRKLLQTANLHTISKKAARPSTIKCGCQWPLHPCALCTGRQDPTAPRDLPDTMPASERVALLDSSFHPVLSFPEDVSHSIHFEAIMRIPEWQNKVIRCTSKAANKGALAAQKNAAHLGIARSSGSGVGVFASSGEDNTKKYHPDGRRKYNKHKIYSQGLVTSKLKKDKSRRGLLLHHHNNNNHRRFKSASSSSATVTSASTKTGLLKKLSKQRKISHSTSTSSQKYGSSNANYDFLDNHHIDGGSGGSSRSKNSSPTPNHSFRNERSLTSDSRRSRNSYDIDNIVIPYSVAAATRVELLPYKEIPTPKWRVIDYEDVKANNKIKNTSQHNNIKIENNEIVVQPIASNETNNVGVDEEDVSEETILVKHERALLEERKKFQSYLKFPWSRSRANRRTDSRAESSGANTPDPTSPPPHTSSVAGDQESIPSPACPSTPQPQLDGQEISESSVVSALNQSINSIHGRRERRRTVSTKLSKDKDDFRRSHTPDIKEVISPFDSLEFPLNDASYEEMLKLMPSDHIALVEDCINKLTSSTHSTNNRLILNKNNLNSSQTNTALSSNLSTSTTLSATENDLDDTEIDELMKTQAEIEMEAAKKVENQLIMEKLLNSCDDGVMIVGVREIGDGEETGDEETDTGESLFAEEDDPNDPEWYDRPGRGRL